VPSCDCDRSVVSGRLLDLWLSFHPCGHLIRSPGRWSHTVVIGSLGHTFPVAMPFFIADLFFPRSDRCGVPLAFRSVAARVATFVLTLGWRRQPRPLVPPFCRSCLIRTVWIYRGDLHDLLRGRPMPLTRVTFGCPVPITLVPLRVDTWKLHRSTLARTTVFNACVGVAVSPSKYNSRS